MSKVDELMALCDRLGVSLVAGNDARCRLLEILLYEALEERLHPIKGASSMRDVRTGTAC